MSDANSFSARQWQIVILVLMAVIAVLAAAYFAFLRVAMVPAYENIRESDTSVIAAELEEAGIPHELRNDGHDVYVPEKQLSDARVAIAGSDAAMGGTVGFELFNDSDMGLTEFAQKINFQRALQGELARTIMAMEGVDFARVHLALPERSLFRSGQGVPTGAVTVQMRPGFALVPERIDGIRQLVASSVPELAYASVAVLNERGDLVSGSPTETADYAPVTERTALEQFYRMRAQQIVNTALPGVPAEIEFTLRPRRDGTGGDPHAAPGRADFSFTVLVRTPYELDPEEREDIENALTDRLELRRESGDVLNFTVGAVGLDRTELASGERPGSIAEQMPAAAVSSAGNSPDGNSWSWPVWPWQVWLLVLLVLVALFSVLRPRRRLDEAEVASFADQLKRLHDRQELDHAA